MLKVQYLRKSGIRPLQFSQASGGLEKLNVRTSCFRDRLLKTLALKPHLSAKVDIEIALSSFKITK